MCRTGFPRLAADIAGVCRPALCRSSRPGSFRCSAGDDFPPGELQPLAAAAYGKFRHAAVAPLVQLDDDLWLLELFHGPTLAFKDLALQLVGPLFDAVLGAAAASMSR